MGKHAVAKCAGDDFEKALAEMNDWTPENLEEEFSRCFSFVAKEFVRMAAIVVICREHDHDLSWLPVSAQQTCLRMANGGLSPAAFEKFDRTLIGRQIHKLPLPEQERLAAGGKVEVFSFPDGKPERRSVDPLDLVQDEVNQVFDFKAGSLRTGAQQRSWLEARAKRTKRAKVNAEVELLSKGIRIRMGEYHEVFSWKTVTGWVAQGTK